MAVAADAMGLALAFVARLVTGAQGHWYGVPPKAEQRIYFANHQSHLDWVLIWAALPHDLRAATRPIAARDYWTAGRFKHWITREVFNAVYVVKHIDVSVRGVVVSVNQFDLFSPAFATGDLHGLLRTYHPPEKLIDP